MKPAKPFQCKQFTIQQSNNVFKVGTDGMLLGAWANVNGASSILDIGCGTGIISLMTAQRNQEAKITSIDFNEEAYLLCKQNAANSKWADRMSAYHSSLEEFAETNEARFDGIITNPPFFSNSTKPNTDVRNTAKHTVNLSIETLVLSVEKLLTEHGVFNIILPVEEGRSFKRLAEESNLFCCELTEFKPKPNKEVERWLMQFRRVKSETKISQLIHLNNEGNYSEAYIELTKAFYTVM